MPLITAYVDLDADDIASVFEELDFDDQLKVLVAISKHFDNRDNLDEVVWTCRPYTDLRSLETFATEAIRRIQNYGKES